MTHDKFCTYRPERQGSGDTRGNFTPYLPPQPCICEPLAKARDDEQYQSAQRVAKLVQYEDVFGRIHISRTSALAAAAGQNNCEAVGHYFVTNVWGTEYRCAGCGAARGEDAK